jgi:hypothetical protein
MPAMARPVPGSTVCLYTNAPDDEFVIEYDNTQDGANHAHAVWRELENDWGEDLLAAHLTAGHS